MSMMTVTVAGAVSNGTAYPVESNNIQGWPAGPEVACETAVLMEAGNGNILYSKGGNELRYPASITKIMTALLAIENLQLDTQVTFSENSVASEPVSYTHLYCEDDSDLYIDYSYISGENLMIRTKSSFHTVKFKFEDTAVALVKNFDAFLRPESGDYMQMPPEGERHNHYASFIDFGDGETCN